MCFKSKDYPISKARALENKADRYYRRNKYSKAFRTYQKSLEWDETRIEVYDKLLNLHEEYSDSWDEEDFAYNMYLTMKKQEIIDPVFKRINARVDPDSQQVSKLIKRMLHANSQKEETQIVEEIASKGDDAIYPLIDFILGYKEMRKQQAAKK